MTWFKVDDSFHSHPKVLAASPAALGLWVVAGSWCGANLSDGFVPDHVLPRLLPDAAPLARELVTCRLWKRTKGGYQFHQWIEYNPSRTEATIAAEKKSSGGTLGNHRRWHVGGGRTDPRCPFCNPSNRDQSHAPEGYAGRTGEGYENGSLPTTQEPVDNSASESRATAEQRKEHRTTDRTTDRPPIGTPNRSEIPRPDPTRPDPKGGSSPYVSSDRAREDQPPPSKCQDHQDHPDPPPCGRCADARRNRDRWEADRRRRVEQAPKCRRHRGQLAHNCAPCRSERLAADTDQEAS